MNKTITENTWNYDRKSVSSLMQEIAHVVLLIYIAEAIKLAYQTALEIFKFSNVRLTSYVGFV